MKDLLDVGSLPEELKERARNMLERRIKAFGFDGRLGKLDAKAPIRVKEGVNPITVPMYSSSSQKRRVIEEQLDKWFEQGVIEPSISPWSAPVVIAYRNGKPHFCVDYRKLNAVNSRFPANRRFWNLSLEPKYSLRWTPSPVSIRWRSLPKTLRKPPSKRTEASRSSDACPSV
jgi:hypothetical protein